MQSYSNHTGSVEQVCETCCKPVVYLESVNSKPTRNTDSFQLDQERRFVAHRLNKASNDCKELPEADHVWMPVSIL